MLKATRQAHDQTETGVTWAPRSDSALHCLRVATAETHREGTTGPTLQSDLVPLVPMGRDGGSLSLVSRDKMFQRNVGGFP